jgi:hypothetical protein
VADDHPAAYLDPDWLRWDEAEKELSVVDPVLEDLARAHRCKFERNVRHPGRVLRRRFGLTTERSVHLTLEVPETEDPPPHSYTIGEGGHKAVLGGWLYYRPFAYRQVAVYSVDDLRDTERIRRDVEAILSSWPS